MDSDSPATEVAVTGDSSEGSSTVVGTPVDVSDGSSLNTERPTDEARVREPAPMNALTLLLSLRESPARRRNIISWPPKDEDRPRDPYDILVIVCSDNTNIACNPNITVRPGVKRIGIFRHAVDRVPSIAKFFDANRQFEDQLEELDFMNEPYISLVLIKRYLMLGPDAFNAHIIKPYLERRFKLADRFCILLRLIKLARGLELLYLVDIAFHMLQDSEDLINGPNMITISRLVFGKNNGFEEIFWLKKWAVKMMAKHCKFLDDSRQFALVVQNGAPVLAEKWARLCQLRRLGPNLFYYIQIDEILNHYDMEKAAHNGKSPHGSSSNEGHTYGTTDAAGQADYDSEGDNYETKIVRQVHGLRNYRLRRGLLANSRLRAAAFGGNARRDHGEQSSGDSNEEGDGHLSEETIEQRKEREDRERNQRAVAALELAVDKFFIAEGVAPVMEADHSNETVEETAAENHASSSATSSTPKQHGSQPFIDHHGAPSSQTTAFQEQQVDNDTENQPQDIGMMLPSGRYSPSAHTHSFPSANTGPDHGCHNDDAPATSKDSNDSQQAQVAPRGVIITPDLEQEDSADLWPLPSNPLPPMNFPSAGEVEDNKQDCNETGATHLLGDFHATIETARAVPIIGRFDGANVIHVAAGSPGQNSSAINNEARQSFTVEDKNAKARKVMGLDQPGGPPGSSMAGDGARIDAQKKHQKKGGFFSKK